MALLIGLPDDCFGGDAASVPSEDPLQTGYICEGGASDPTGDNLWCDTSSGTSYGDGRRYQHEETQYMTRVKSRHNK